MSWEDAAHGPLVGISTGELSYLDIFQIGDRNPSAKQPPRPSGP